MKKLNAWLFGAFLTSQLFITNVYADVPTYAGKGVIDSFQAFIKEYNYLLTGAWGFFMTSSILIFIIHLIKLGQYSDNPFARKKIMGDILITGVCTALLGSFGLVFYLITALVLT